MMATDKHERLPIHDLFSGIIEPLARTIGVISPLNCRIYMRERKTIPHKFVGYFGKLMWRKTVKSRKGCQGHEWPEQKNMKRAMPVQW